MAISCFSVRVLVATVLLSCALHAQTAADVALLQTKLNEARGSKLAEDFPEERDCNKPKSEYQKGSCVVMATRLDKQAGGDPSLAEKAWLKACGAPAFYSANRGEPASCSQLGRFYLRQGQSGLALAAATLKACGDDRYEAVACMMVRADVYKQSQMVGDEKLALEEACKGVDSNYDMNACNRLNSEMGMQVDTAKRYEVGLQGEEAWLADLQERQARERDLAQQASAQRETRVDAVLGALNGATAPAIATPAYALPSRAPSTKGPEESGRLVPAAQPASQPVSQPASVASSSPQASQTASAVSPSRPASGLLPPRDNRCIARFYDPNLYNWLSVRNDCAEPVHLSFQSRVTPSPVFGALDLAVGQVVSTGHSSEEVDAAGGVLFYVCPLHYVAVDVAGKLVSEGRPTGSFACQPQ